MHLKGLNRLAMGLVAVVALAACGGGDESGTSSPSSITTTTVGAGATTTPKPTTGAGAAAPVTASTRPAAPTPPATDPTPASAEAVARRFWNATWAADRAEALSVGVADVYDYLRSFVSSEESRIDPSTFSFLGCEAETAGSYTCEYRSTAGSIVDQVFLTVGEDSNGRLSVGSVRRDCMSEYGPCP